MQITFEQYGRIQIYLDGKMTPPEENEFLEALNQDQSLKESFEFEKELRQNLASMQSKKDIIQKGSGYYETEINVQDAKTIRNLIAKAGNEWEEENKKSSDLTRLIGDRKLRTHKSKIVNIRSWLAIASVAGVILAVAGLVLLMPESSKPPSAAKSNDTSLVKKNTGTDITKIIPRDSVKNNRSEIQKINGSALFKKYYTKDMSNPPMPGLLAMVPAAYQRGNYSYTERLDLENVPNTRGSSNDLNSKQNILQFAHYYKGLSFIETKDNPTAIENLRWVIDSAHSPQLKSKAQWYLALIYINEDNLQKAMPLLLALSKTPDHGPYHEQAAGLLETIQQQGQHK